MQSCYSIHTKLSYLLTAHYPHLQLLCWQRFKGTHGATLIQLAHCSFKVQIKEKANNNDDDPHMQKYLSHGT
jgi:hypothetical protein